MDPVEGARFINGDVRSEETLVDIQEAINLRPVDLILADLSMENKEENESQMQNLNLASMGIAMRTLKIGGTMLLKSLD
jgi:23S rRNA U2552 (ribose-2'-O)-methylase RlmE/FtsJ